MASRADFASGSGPPSSAQTTRTTPDSGFGTNEADRQLQQHKPPPGFQSGQQGMPMPPPHGGPQNYRQQPLEPNPYYGVLNSSAVSAPPHPGQQHQMPGNQPPHHMQMQPPQDDPSRAQMHRAPHQRGPYDESQGRHGVSPPSAGAPPHIQNQHPGQHYNQQPYMVGGPPGSVPQHQYVSGGPVPGGPPGGPPRSMPNAVGGPPGGHQQGAVSGYDRDTPQQYQQHTQQFVPHHMMQQQQHQTMHPQQQMGMVGPQQGMPPSQQQQHMVQQQMAQQGMNPQQHGMIVQGQMVMRPHPQQLMQQQPHQQQAVPVVVTTGMPMQNVPGGMIMPQMMYARGGPLPQSQVMIAGQPQPRIGHPPQLMQYQPQQQPVPQEGDPSRPPGMVQNMQMNPQQMQQQQHRGGMQPKPLSSGVPPSMRDSDYASNVSYQDEQGMHVSGQGVPPTAMGGYPAVPGGQVHPHSMAMMQAPVHFQQQRMVAGAPVPYYATPLIVGPGPQYGYPTMANQPVVYQAQQPQQLQQNPSFNRSRGGINRSFRNSSFRSNSQRSSQDNGSSGATPVRSEAHTPVGSAEESVRDERTNIQELSQKINEISVADSGPALAPAEETREASPTECESTPSTASLAQQQQRAAPTAAARASASSPEEERVQKNVVQLAEKLGTPKSERESLSPKENIPQTIVQCDHNMDNVRSLKEYCSFCLETGRPDYDKHVLRDQNDEECRAFREGHQCGKCSQFGHIGPNCPDYPVESFLAEQRSQRSQHHRRPYTGGSSDGAPAPMREHRQGGVSRGQGGGGGGGYQNKEGGGRGGRYPPRQQYDGGYGGQSHYGRGEGRGGGGSYGHGHQRGGGGYAGGAGHRQYDSSSRGHGGPRQ